MVGFYFEEVSNPFNLSMGRYLNVDANSSIENLEMINS